MYYKHQFIWMLWFVLIASFVGVGIYLVGHASADTARQQETINQSEHLRQLECIEAGGHMEIPTGRSGSMFCTK